jgi:signal transduction protein with GAF and PtsI domain
VVIYPARTGIGVSMVGLDLHANFFQSCVRTGGALQLRDAQRHPLLGAMCQLEGIKSLIIVPIFHNLEVVGAMEFFYKEMRTFSTGEVMDLELIAGVVWENLSFAGDIKGAEQPEREVDGKMAGDDNTKALIPGTAEAVVRTSEAQRIAAAPNRLAKAWKKVWKNAPTVTENVASIEPRAEAEIGEPEDSSRKDIGSQKSSSS